jgi:hypothetical protein
MSPVYSYLVQAWLASAAAPSQRGMRRLNFEKNSSIASSKGIKTSDTDTLINDSVAGAQ